jgi:Chaperone of endosialidase
MKNIWQSLVFALVLAGTAYAQVPSTNDTSDGSQNTGMGTGALGGPTPTNLTGNWNTASGFQALYKNTTGSDNTASGLSALYTNTTGKNNTAIGEAALHNNNQTNNTALGLAALYSNTTGYNNTASGARALYTNVSGLNNTASGFVALQYSTTGSNNTAFGSAALYGIVGGSTGSDNTAIGFNALYSYSTGDNNTASGYQALYQNTSGGDNTAVGDGALSGNSTGAGNTALGYNAGALITDSNNIDIGNEGVATDSGVIRIGTRSTHRQAFIVGIYTTSMIANSLPVYVDSAGRLSAGTSSERFKTAITPMGSETAKLGQLRPVSFKLKSDATGTRQYGLIAEEVAKVYPDLVIRDVSGRIDGVRYDELAPMLLNEVQQQAAKILTLEQQVADMHAALLKVQAKDERVAQR